MKVGIISKEAHAKSHAAALEEAGFVPVMLGSNPSEIPPTVPLLVCRTLSCAHGGMDTALAWSRAGHGTLIVENGVKAILTKALRARAEAEAAPLPPTVEDEAEVPRLSYEDLREAAQALAEARPDDGYEVLVAVLSRMYPNEEESLLRSVAATVRPPVVPSEPEAPVEEIIPVVAALPTPPTIPEISPPPVPVVTRPYPNRFADRLSEADANARMNHAWEVRGEMTDDEAALLGRWAAKGAVSKVPCGEHLKKCARNPLAFAGLLLLCAEKPLTQRDITHAYKAVTGKKYFALMADVAAWTLNMKLEVATNAIRRNPAPTRHPAPIEEVPVSVTTPPVAAPSDDSTLILLKALSASLDALLAKVVDIDERVEGLTSRIEAMSKQALASSAPVSAPATNTSTEDALAVLAHKGLEVVVRPSR
jgi:hypothetical protein